MAQANKSTATKATTTKVTARKATPTKASAKKATARKATTSAVKKAPAKKATAKKATAKKASAKRATARKATTSAVKKATAKKATAKKATAKKATAKKATAKKAIAKKATVKRAATATASVTTAATKKNVAATKKATTEAPFDAVFLAEQRRLLLEERATYTRQADSLQAEADSLAELREPGDVQFDEESGEGDTLAVERERDLALSARAREQVDEIDRALAKLEAGTYGICEVSGDPIPRARLQAIPQARERVEYKVGGFHRR